MPRTVQQIRTRVDDATRAEKKAAKASYRQQMQERESRSGVRTVPAAGPVDLRKEKTGFLKELDSDIARGERFIKSASDQVKELSQRIKDYQLKTSGMKALRRQIESAASKADFDKARNTYGKLKWSNSQKASLLAL